jgi:hypothetical protein
MALTKVTSGLISADASSVDLNIDAGTLYIDATNNNVGIGTTSPNNYAGWTTLTINGPTTGSEIDLEIAGTATGALYATSTTVGLQSTSGSNADLVLRTNSIERMRVDTSGNVGIGISDPNNKGKLTINGEASVNGFDVGLAIITNASNSTSPYLKIGDEQGVAIRGEHTGTWGRKDMCFYTSNNTGTSAFNPVERMRITRDGNVGIGTSSPSRKLHVNSGIEGISAGIAGTTYGIRFDNGGTFSSGMSTIHGVDSSFTSSYQPIRLNGSDVRFATGNNERMRIDGSGNLFWYTAPGSTASNPTLKINTSTGYIYYDSSSLRYKENVQNLPSALSNVIALRPVTFDEISSGESCFGLIAEEVNEVIPELVHFRNIDGFDTPQPDSVSYDKLSVFLLKAIQELSNKVDNQQVLIEQLQAEVALLKGE